MRALAAPAAVALSLTSGCLAIIDDGSGGGDGDGAHRLRIAVPADVDLALYQEDDGPWLPMAIGDDGYAEAEILAPRFAHVVVCPYRNQPPGWPPGKHVTVQRRTRNDALQPDPCAAPPMVPLDPFITNGEAMIFVGDSAHISGGRLDVPAGIWDVAVVGLVPSSSMVIVRDYDLRAGGQLYVDLLTQAFPMAGFEDPTIDRGGVIDDYVSVRSHAYLERGTHAVFGQYEAAAPVSSAPLRPPAGMLTSEEPLLLDIGSGTSSGARGHQRPVSGPSAGAFALPPHLGGAVSADGATWIGDWDVARLSLNYASPAEPPPVMNTSVVQLSASRGWLSAAGAGATLPRFDPTTLPGWDAAWMPTPTWIGWELRAQNGDPRGEMRWASSFGGGPP